MIKGLILDIDQTLIDSSAASDARRMRAWRDVYSMIPNFVVYDGICDAISVARQKGLKICIVSTAPRTYIERVIHYHKIYTDYIIGYHDAHPVKPHPAPILKALEIMGLRCDEVLSFGDRYIDETASNAAGVKFVACLWGSDEFDKGRLLSPSSLMIAHSHSLSEFIINNI